MRRGRLLQTPLAPLFSEQKRGDEFSFLFSPSLFPELCNSNREKGRGCPKGGGGFLGRLHFCAIRRYF